MLHQTKITLLLGLLMAGSVSVQAEEPRGGTKWGPFRALPRVDLEYIATDNLFNTRNQEKSSGIVVINPGLGLEAGTPTMKYILDADLEAGEVTRSHDDDYIDLDLFGQAIYQPTSRVRLDLSAEYQKEHEDRGTGRSEGGRGTSKHPDEYDQTDLGGELTYGIAGAKGQIILNLDYTNLEFTNNRVGTRVRDRDEFGQGGIFKWRVGPKTTVLFEARNRDFDYDFTPAGIARLDSDEQSYFVGVEWQASYKTTGAFRVGHIRKDFDASTRKDVSEGAWEAGVEWKPRSYSVVSVLTGRTFGETNGTGNASLTDYFNLSWDHQWMDRFSTTVSYYYAEDEYPGSATAITGKRVDDSDTYAFEANYEARRWLTLGAGFEHIDKDSNFSTFNYDRNNLFINARMKF